MIISPPFPASIGRLAIIPDSPFLRQVSLETGKVFCGKWFFPQQSFSDIAILAVYWHLPCQASIPIRFLHDLGNGMTLNAVAADGLAAGEPV